MRRKKHSAVYYIELIFLNILQLNSDGAFPGFEIINIAYSVRCEVCMAVLKIGDLILPVSDIRLASMSL